MKAFFEKPNRLWEPQVSRGARLTSPQCFYNLIYMRRWRNWQTRWIQVPVVAILCGFKSHPPHQKSSSFGLLFLLRKQHKSHFAVLFKNPLQAKHEPLQRIYFLFGFFKRNFSELSAAVFVKNHHRGTLGVGFPASDEHSPLFSDKLKKLVFSE